MSVPKGKVMTWEGDSAGSLCGSLCIAQFSTGCFCFPLCINQERGGWEVQNVLVISFSYMCVYGISLKKEIKPNILPGKCVQQEKEMSFKSLLHLHVREKPPGS